MASLKTMVVLIFAVLFSVCESKDAIVGGKEGWKIPVDSSNNYLNQWSSGRRFEVGDYLVFQYDGKDDETVVEVTKEDYDNCKRSKAIKVNKGKRGLNIVELDRLGPFYFISGADGHCEKGQKLEVVVTSKYHWFHRHRYYPPAPAGAPGSATKRKSAASHLLRADFLPSLASSLLGFALAFA